MANDFTSRLIPVKKDSAPGEDFQSRLIPLEKEEGGFKSAARSVLQPILGALERFTFPANLVDPASKEVLREISEGDEMIIPEVAEAARARAEQFVPTQERGERLIEEAMGVPLHPKTRGQRLLRLGGQAKQPQRILPSIVAPAVSVGAKAAGLSEPTSDLLGQFISAFDLRKPASTKPAKKPPTESIVEPKQPRGGPPPLEIETFPSGLTKSRAVEAPHAKKAILSPERQEKALKAIDAEAAELTKKVVAKRLPQSEKILKGHDFEGEFADRFGQLEKAAGKANPEIDITDISEFLSTARKKYSGLPVELLDVEGRKILKEIGALRNRPQLQLKNLLKLFRLNNKKRSEIFERRFLTGKQKDYENFLKDLNRSIVKSFERTFPEDSPWIKEFKDLNSGYSGYINAQKTLNALEPILEGKATSSKIAGLAEDARKQKKLALSMGKEGADEIIQIAKDMKTAREAIKRIPSKTLKEMDSIFPLGVFIPGIKIPGTFGLVKKGVEYGRRVYGWYLTTPARRQAFDNAVKAIEKGDKSAYAKATEDLKKEAQKQIPFQAKKQIEFKANPASGK